MGCHEGIEESEIQKKGTQKMIKQLLLTQKGGTYQ